MIFTFVADEEKDNLKKKKTQWKKILKLPIYTWK